MAFTTPFPILRFQLHYLGYPHSTRLGTKLWFGITLSQIAATPHQHSSLHFLRGTRLFLTVPFLSPGQSGPCYQVSFFYELIADYRNPLLAFLAKIILINSPCEFFLCVWITTRIFPLGAQPNDVHRSSSFECASSKSVKIQN